MHRFTDEEIEEERRRQELEEYVRRQMEEEKNGGSGMGCFSALLSLALIIFVLKAMFFEPPYTFESIAVGIVCGAVSLFIWFAFLF